MIVAVFTATGIGMALPYLVLAAWPGAARILPKPGAWTGIMERLVGFFLMGTAIYLLSILPESRGSPRSSSLLVCALAAWCGGQWGGLAGLGASKALYGRARAPYGMRLHLMDACNPPPNRRRGKRSGRTRSVRC